MKIAMGSYEKLNLAERLAEELRWWALPMAVV